ncbi:TetR family transcriptional regulator [soil metagenome]
MVAGQGGVDDGLRERKKRRTRASLIDAALELSERQGYEHTTVEQIAVAVDVSARTFTRYFPTKDSVILSLLENVTAAVNAELFRQPANLPPFQALLAANLAVLDRARAGGAPMSGQRVLSFWRTLNNSPSLQRLATDVRTHETSDAMAKRLSVSADDRAVKLISAVWAAVIASAWGTLGTPAGPHISSARTLPELMSQRLTDTFAEFTDVTSRLSKTS